MTMVADERVEPTIDEEALPPEEGGAAQQKNNDRPPAQQPRPDYQVVDVDSMILDETDRQKKAMLRSQMSMPSRHQDPFAMREGKTLVWKDINMTLVRNSRSNQVNKLASAVLLWSFPFLSAIGTSRPSTSTNSGVNDLLISFRFSNRLESARATPNACFSKMCGVRSQAPKLPPSWVPQVSAGNLKIKLFVNVWCNLFCNSELLNVHSRISQGLGRSMRTACVLVCSWLSK